MASTESPSKFVKPADLFRMRHSTSSCPAFEAQSPLKCLNNLAEPSPIKKLPTLLRNPFNNHPAKRRLNLGSPMKKTKLLGLDEDANLEAPKMKIAHLQETKPKVCFRNSWTLHTKLKINFNQECKNWLDSSTSTHGRNYENSPSKLTSENPSISVEAIRNSARVYQHPYLAWQQLYPRIEKDFDFDYKPPLTLKPNSEIAKMLSRDWAKSFEDLTNMLLYGKCPYFYFCSNLNTIFFRQLPSSKPSKPHVQAYISPFTNSMGLTFNKLKIEFRAIDQKIIDNINNFSSSLDSGNVSDFSDDEQEDEADEDKNEDGLQIIQGFGIPHEELPYRRSIKSCISGSDTSSSQPVLNKSTLPLVLVEGRNNMRRLVKFLQTNYSYTIQDLGKFACIPPTLLSPREFRLSTPQYPEVTLSKNMTNDQDQQSPDNSQDYSSTPMKPRPKVVSGTSFVELSGTILPSVYKELHKLLTLSDNMQNHTCQSNPLKSSVTFGSIQELP